MDEQVEKDISDTLSKVAGGLVEVTPSFAKPLVPSYSLDMITMKKEGEYIRLKIKRNLELVKKLFENIIHDDGFICGGFVRVCVTEHVAPIPSGDIDIYCKGQEQFDAILGRLKENGYFEKRSSETATTMQYAFEGALPVQLIKSLNEGNVRLSSDKVEDILNNFDFSIARVAITKESLASEEGIADSDFPEDDKAKRLNIKNIHCPVAQVYRISKYIEKGFWCNIMNLIKVFEDWKDRPDSYKQKILDVIMKEEPSKEEIQELESLLHID